MFRYVVSVLVFLIFQSSILANHRFVFIPIAGSVANSQDVQISSLLLEDGIEFLKFPQLLLEQKLMVLEVLVVELQFMQTIILP